MSVATIEMTGHSHDPWKPVQDAVLAEAAAALRAEGVDVDATALANELVVPTAVAADLALPMHRFAKATGRDPTALAEAVAARFRPSSEIERVEGLSGYVNVHAAFPDLARRTLQLVFEGKERYGNGPGRTESVCVEHTSANPTGPLHIGRVRGAVLGDTLARILRAAGYPTVTQYYVDDVGRAAALISWMWSKPLPSWPPELRSTLPPDGAQPPGEKVDQYLGRPYPAANAYVKTHPEASAEVQQISRDLERGVPPPLHETILQQVLDGMLLSLGRLGIRFDEFAWESTFLGDGSVDAVRERLLRTPHAMTEENGAHAIDASSYGLPSESARIIVSRGDGTSLYVTRDVAYHLQKFSRFDRVIDVLGSDHVLHARTLEALFTEMDEARRPEFLLYQFITIAGGGKMSTRAGTAVSLDSLLDEAVRRARVEVSQRRDDLPAEEIDRIAEKVGTGAIRYVIARVAPEKGVKFQWEEALSFEGRTGPFLQYAFARAAAVLRKAGLSPHAPFPFDPTGFHEPGERRLLREIARWPGTIDHAASSGQVQGVGTYAHELAEAFNSFYQSVPVLSSEPELRTNRLALVAAARQTMGNALRILGIEPLETM
ncbi:MAG: arginine--tRNA ligase [Thermoplasmata archaeon]|nr:arginine--tRNA ligase [Thermoplasmata archaeon]